MTVVGLVVALSACGPGGGDSDGPAPTVTVSGPGVIEKGQSAQLFASVSDGTSDVTWQVVGGADYGTITPSGLYTAPSVVPDGKSVVRATSKKDSRGSGSMAIQVIVGAESLEPRSNVALSPTGAIANTFSGGQRGVAVYGDIVYMVWNDDRLGDQDVYVSVSIDRGLSFGNPVKVNTDLGGEDQRAPSIAVDALGRAVVAWLDGRFSISPSDPTYDVYVASIEVDQSGLVTVMTNQRVTMGGTPESRDPTVSLAVDAVGNLYVAWGDGTTGDTDVLLTRGAPLENRQFNFLSVPIRVHEHFLTDQSRPSVAVTADGDVVIAWGDRQAIPGQVLVDWDVYWRRGRISAMGVFESPMLEELRVNAETLGDQVSPSVAVDASGTAYVAWGQQMASGRRRVYLARSSSQDLTVESLAEVLSSGGVDSDQNFPSLIVSGSEVTVAFGDNRVCSSCAFDPLDPDGTGPTDVYLVRSVDGGVTFGPSVRVNDDQNLALHGRASVAVDGVGRAFVVWTDSRAGVTEAQAYRARVE